MRFHLRLSILFLLIPLVLLGARLDACTSFCIEYEDKLVFGRNYDWSVSVAMVIVNKRGLSKTALIDSPDVPAQWTSTFGSITFNQYGRELPQGGVNEAGLVVESMWLSGTSYPDPDERPALRELAWIQYQLDTCETVDDVIASDAKIRILKSSVPIHFLVCDRSGQTAAIEFLDGKMVVHKGEEMPATALANTSYADSLEYLKQIRGFGGQKGIPQSTASRDRFVRAAYGVKMFQVGMGEDITGEAFKILENVSQGPATKWSIVYDVKNSAVHFRTAASPDIKILNLEDLDFSCETPCRVLDIDTKEPGDAGNRFVDFSLEINRKLVFDSWKNTEFLKDTPDVILDLVAVYPNTIKPVKKEAEQD